MTGFTSITDLKTLLAGSEKMNNVDFVEWKQFSILCFEF